MFLFFFILACFFVLERLGRRRSLGQLEAGKNCFPGTCDMSHRVVERTSVVEGHARDLEGKCSSMICRSRIPGAAEKEARGAYQHIPSSSHQCACTHGGKVMIEDVTLATPTPGRQTRNMRAHTHARTIVLEDP